METFLLALDSVYGLIFAAATVLAALQSQRDMRLARGLVIVGAMLMAVRWSIWALTTEASWTTRGSVGALIGAALFILVPGAIHWLSDRIVSEDAAPEKRVEAPAVSSPPVRTPTPSPNGVYKYIADGLTTAREDLLNIKKDRLSCNEMSAWQARADTSTRLAHAKGIQIHNSIAQHLGACQKVTDVELLDAIRTSIVQLLDQGIMSAKNHP